MGLEDYFRDFDRRDWELDSVDGTVRVAVIGIGGFARERAIPGMAEGTYCEPTVLVSGSPDRARTTAEAYGIERVIDYDAYLAGTTAAAYDAVYVATPNAIHPRYAVAAADRGKHVVCEKPLAATVEGAREIVDACERADVTAMTAYRLQLEPTVRRTRELVRDGVVGEVVQVHGGFSNPLLEYAGADTWRLDAGLAGGGALVDLGIYPLNTVRFLLEEEPVCVYANTHSSGPPFDEVDEHVAFQLKFPDGATASCTASFDAHANSQLQLVGTDGMVHVESPFGGVVPQNMVIESGDFRMEYTGSPVDEVREEFDYFGYCVLSGTRPEPDGIDGVADLRVIEDAYESAESGREVPLE